MPGTGIDRPQRRWVLESLVGLDEKGEPVPQLATSWDANPTAKTISFTLRQGVKFHDGTEFNAEAVKWNMDMYRNGANPDLKLVTSIDVIDSTHVRVTLSAWDPLFIPTLCSTGAGAMVSPTAGKQLGEKAMLNPVGTGPFKFVSYEPNVSIKYVKNPDYWQKGLPYLDAVEWKFVADPVVRLASFTKGEAQVINELTPKDGVALKKQGNDLIGNVVRMDGIAGDMKDPSSPFADIRVRQAIAYAVDTKAVVDAVYEGMYPVTNQLALPDRSAYDTSIKGYPYNPEKAKELLAAAGYSTAKPLVTKISYTTNQDKTDYYTLVQSYFSKVGINLTLEPLDSAAFTKMITSGWNKQLVDYQLSYNEIEMKYSSSLAACLSAKPARYMNVITPDAFNKLYDSMLGESDMAKRTAAYKQLNKMAVDEYCLVVPMHGYQLYNARSPKVHDLGLSNKASEFLPERAWLSK
jgi:peptide/nickel transport system substrate-binding protein